MSPPLWLIYEGICKASRPPPPLTPPSPRLILFFPKPFSEVFLARGASYPPGRYFSPFLLLLLNPLFCRSGFHRDLAFFPPSVKKFDREAFCFWWFFCSFSLQRYLLIASPFRSWHPKLSPRWLSGDGGGFYFFIALPSSSPLSQSARRGRGFFSPYNTLLGDPV